MKKFFLIDTNIWTALLNEDKEGYLLSALESFIKSDKLILLIPQILLEEWEKEKKKQIEQRRKAYLETINNTTRSTSQHIRQILNYELEKVKNRAEKIDYILRSNKPIRISAKVKSDTIDRSRSGLAPFHKNKLSFNDSQLYFSVIEYLKKNRLNDFVFVTKDKNDFGNPGNENLELHKDLIITGITTCYFTELGWAFNSFKEEFPLPPKPNFSTTRDYRIVVVEQREENILNYLHSVLVKALEQINFVPISILLRIDPFRIVTLRHNYTYYANFNLQTNNEKLYNFFQELEIGTIVRFKKGSKFRNTKENVKKATEIVQILNGNNVDSISCSTNTKEIDIRLSTHATCDCVRCSFFNFQFSKAISKTENHSNEIEEKIKVGYVLYQFGFYEKSILVLHEAYLEAVDKGLHVIAFRIVYNLLWQKNYVLLYKTPELTKVGEVLNSLNISKEYYIFANAPDYEQELASFYYQHYFYYNYSDEIAETVEKIKSHYESQMRGGYSNNQNYWNLICQYYEFEKFTRINSLTFSKFSNFKTVVQKYTEGILYSLFLNEYQQGRPKYITDFNLAHLLLYGDPKEISKLYNRQKANRIKYEPDNPTGRFEQLLDNFFFDRTYLFENKRTANEEWNDFLITYENYFLNFLVILSIVEFEEKIIRKANKYILSFLKNLDLPNIKNEYISWFIKRNNYVIPNKDLYDYFTLFIEDKRFHDEDLFYSFYAVRERIEMEDKKLFDLIIETFFGICPKCKRQHSRSLYSIYPLLSHQLKKELSKLIEEKLQFQMDTDLYYHSAIMEIIDYKKMFKEYLQKIVPKRENRREHSFFPSGEILYTRFNELMNIVFKNNIRLPNKTMTSFKGMSDYYDWLVDMKQFDYSKFNPLWILQYPTDAYLFRIFSITKIRKCVEEYLKRNNQPTLSKYYVEYCKKDAKT